MVTKKQTNRLSKESKNNQWRDGRGKKGQWPTL